MFVWIAFFFSALTYLHSYILIDFADEGFLWYGVLQVMHGLVPIRDFQSYDPGRYYWCAAIMSMCCKGLMSLRFSAGVFQFIALCSGLAVLRRINRSVWFLMLSGMLMTLWMLLSYRYFDSGMALIALFFAVRLAEKPTLRRHLAAGVFTGVAAFFGINHGLYCLSALGLLLVFLNMKRSIPHASKKWLFYGLGLALGLIPFVILCLFVPGFAKSYREQLSMLYWVTSTGRAATSAAATWPWQLRWEGSLLSSAQAFARSGMYLFILVYYFLLTPSIFKFHKVDTQSKAIFTASIFVGLSYLRHAFSHNDICYLGEGILPVWIGLAALANTASQKRARRAAMAAAILFVLGTVGAAGIVHPIVFQHMVSKNAMTWYPVGSDNIWLPRTDAQIIEETKQLIGTYVKPEEPILIAPLMTTLYCVLGKESPVYELYFHAPPLPAMEKKEIQSLEEKNVRWALIADVEVNGLPEKMLHYSHPLLWQYLSEKFDVVPGSQMRTGYFLMKRKA